MYARIRISNKDYRTFSGAHKVDVSSMPGLVRVSMARHRAARPGEVWPDRKLQMQLTTEEAESLAYDLLAQTARLRKTATEV